MTPDLCYLPAREVLSRFGDQSLSPVDYLEALIARSDAMNPSINAWAETFFDEARNSARTAARAWANGTARPLEGLPVAVKDIQRVAGQRTTQGSLVFRDHVETTSDPMIERLLAAGAIIHGRTTTPEFCLSGTCWSRLWGVTRNPHNRDFGPGGSSGGSAAVLAAGMAPVATGTDIGGSIRIPASACGVVGFKPPHGRNPDGPPANFDRYNHCGVLTRDVGDTGLLQNLISGPHPLDHDSLRDRVTIPDRFAPRPLRIAWSMDLGYAVIGRDVRANMARAIDRLAAAGHAVEEVSPDWGPWVDEGAMRWYNAMHFGRTALWLRDQHRDQLTPYALAMAEAAANLGPDDVARSFEAQHRMYQTLGPILARSDVLLCPTLAIAGVAADHDPLTPFQIEGVTVDGEYGWEMTHPFNMLSNCPVMSVPTGRDSNGVPTGMQIVGPTFADLAVFEAAHAWERIAPEVFLPLSGIPAA